VYIEVQFIRQLNYACVRASVFHGKMIFCWSHHWI